MLVLSRKMQQRIIIGDGIEITVLAISGNRVRLGINAPPDVPIHREELARLMCHAPCPQQTSDQLQVQETL